MTEKKKATQMTNPITIRSRRSRAQGKLGHVSVQGWIRSQSLDAWNEEMAKCEDEMQQYLYEKFDKPGASKKPGRDPKKKPAGS